MKVAFGCPTSQGLVILSMPVTHSTRGSKALETPDTVLSRDFKVPFEITNPKVGTFA